MNRSGADEMVWGFEDNRSDIAIVEEVLAIAQERIAVIPVFLVEGILKFMKGVSVNGEHIGSDSDEGANTRLAMDFACIAFCQKLALVPANSLANGSTDLKLLNMDMLVPVHMSRFVEPELEDNVFASVASQIQAEGIQTLNVKGIGRREDNIRIDGHRHHRCVGSALKQIEITDVQAWILFRKFGIEMMGHMFPPCQCVFDYSRLCSSIGETSDLRVCPHLGGAHLLMGRWRTSVPSSEIQGDDQSGCVTVSSFVRPPERREVPAEVQFEVAPNTVTDITNLRTARLRTGHGQQWKEQVVA